MSISEDKENILPSRPSNSHVTPKEMFGRHMSEIINNSVTGPSTDKASPVVDEISESDTSQNKRGTAVPSYRDFVIIKPISRGAFGKVFLGYKKNKPNKKYAIKVMKKADMVHKNLVNQVIAERNALALSKSPFIVRLYYSLQSELHIYLVMEYMIGGDVKSLLSIYGFFDEDMAVMYTAEITLALEYLHSHGIIHRDLKPDNLLISAAGHIKLTDFGLSQVNLNRQICISDVVNTPNINHCHSPLKEDYLRTPGQILSLTSDFAFTVPHKRSVLSKRWPVNSSISSPVSLKAGTGDPLPDSSHFISPPICSLTPTMKESLISESPSTHGPKFEKRRQSPASLTYSGTDSSIFMTNSTPRSCMGTNMGIQKSYAAQNLKSLRESSVGQPTALNCANGASDTTLDSIEMRRHCNLTVSPEDNVKKLCFSTECFESAPFYRRKRPFLCVEKSPYSPKAGMHHSHSTGLTSEFAATTVGDEHRLKRQNSSIEYNSSTVASSSALSQKLDFSHTGIVESFEVSEKNGLDSSSCDLDESNHRSLVNMEMSLGDYHEDISEKKQSTGKCCNKGSPETDHQSESFKLNVHSEEDMLDAGHEHSRHDHGNPCRRGSVDLSDTSQSLDSSLQSLSLDQPLSSTELSIILEDGHGSTANDADISSLSTSIDDTPSDKPVSITDHSPGFLPEQQIHGGKLTADECNQQDKVTVESQNASASKDQTQEPARALLPFKMMRFSSLPTCMSTTDTESYDFCNTPLRTQNWNGFKTPTFSNNHTPLRTPKSVRRGPQNRNNMERILGTPDYLAPELLLQTDHGAAVDWWALGVCLYEFLTGVPPFNDTTPEAVFQNILNRDLLWPEGEESLSTEAQDAIQRLLDMDPVTRATAKELKTMPLMKNLDWANLLNCTPHFVPKPDNDTDTTYFEARNSIQDLKLSAVDMDIWQ